MLIHFDALHAGYSWNALFQIGEIGLIRILSEWLLTETTKRLGNGGWLSLSEMDINALSAGILKIFMLTILSVGQTRLR